MMQQCYLMHNYVYMNCPSINLYLWNCPNSDYECVCVCSRSK